MTTFRATHPRSSSPLSKARLGALLLVGLLAGCAKPAPVQDWDAQLQRDLEFARSDRWAMQCAPSQLAMVETHHSFAMLEFEQGDSREAERHLSIARNNMIITLGKAEQCRPKDLDGDGIEDHLDQCPEEAELVNDYKDDDGCPEKDDDNDGVFNDADRCPTEREDPDGWQDDDGCPDVDNDNDGLLDIADKCPNEPEDLNGYQDEDGCPEGNADRDLDGVFDYADKCPDEPENVNEYLDEDGCPDVKPDNIRVTADRIEIQEKVLFSTGRSRILSSSYGILNSVAQVLRDYPSIKVRIEGHTDSQGSESLNKRLSQQRAKAVFDYLSAQGIQGSRMAPEGFGEERPIDTNRTSEGRTNNRRVEFHITDK